MKRYAILFWAVAILTSGLASAEHIDLGKGFDVNVTVEESNSSRTVVELEVGAFERTPVETDSGKYYKITCNNEALFTNQGEPGLPQLLRDIIISDNQDVEINVLSSEYTDFDSMPVAPSKGLWPTSVDPDTIPYTFGAVYDSNAWYPSQLSEITGPFIMRDYRGATIKVNAFQYNPQTRVLRVYTSVRVEITSTGHSQLNFLERGEKPRKRIKAFEEMYENQFINYSYCKNKSGYVEASGDMLIITPAVFHDYMMPLVDWKRQKGIKTTMVDVNDIGNDSSSITNFLKTYYDSTDLAWLLLVGDVNYVATPYALGPFSLQGVSPADPVYSFLEGDDNSPEIFVGRFSAEDTLDVQTQVYRSITYERDHPAACYHLGTCIASATEQDIAHAKEIVQLLKGFTYTQVDTMFETMPPWGQSTATFSSYLNQGRGIISFAGHGDICCWNFGGCCDPSEFCFQCGDVDGLTNINKLPFIYSTACYVGAMDGPNPCLAEHWLRGTYNGDYKKPIGAIATYMASNQSVYAKNQVMADLLVHHGMSTIGALCFNTLLNEGGNFRIHNIFGDPSLQLCTAIPEQLVVNHDSTIDPNQSEYNVEVVGVEGALCALYNDGTLYGSAYTNANGMANIPIQVFLPEEDSLTLTVTAFNKATHIEKVPLSNFPPQNFHVKTWADTTVNLAWIPRAAWNSLGYNIYRDTLSGGPGVKINYGDLIPQPDSEYQDTGLTFGRTYYYTITNVDTNNQESDPSKQIRISIGQGSVPTGLVVQIVGCDIRLSWHPNPPEDSVMKYRIYRKEPVASEYEIFDSVGIVGTYLDTNITSNGDYFYKITAVNDLGLESYFSVPASLDFEVPVYVPGNFRISDWLGTDVTLIWSNHGGEAGFDIYRSNDSGVFNSPPINDTLITGLIYHDSGLIEGNIYYYVATSTGECGIASEHSNQAGFLAGKPQTPVGLAANLDGNCKIALSWRSNPDEEIAKYKIYHINYPDTLFQVKDSVFAPETTYVDTSINDGLNHCYVIVAIDTLGLESNKSGPPVCASLTPQNPTDIIITSDTDTSVTLRGLTEWFEDLVGCNFYRSLVPHQYSGLEPINDTLLIPDESGMVQYTDFDITEGTYYYIVTNVNRCGFESVRCPCRGSITPPGGGTKSGTEDCPNGWLEVVFSFGIPNPPLLRVESGRENIKLFMSSSDTDIKGYKIFRNQNNGPFQIIDSLCLDTMYTDIAVTGGISYRYKATAIDTLNLESSPSSEKEGVVFSFDQGMILVDMTQGSWVFGDGVNLGEIITFYQRALSEYVYDTLSRDISSLTPFDLSRHRIAIVYSEEIRVDHSLDSAVTYETLRQYLKAGGKLMIEGRRNLSGKLPTFGFRHFDAGDFRHDNLNIDSAYIPSWSVGCDSEEFVGANRTPQMEGYPQVVELDTSRINLPWYPLYDFNGKLPGMGYLIPLDSSEVIYTFVSADSNTSICQGKPVALQHIADSSMVIYFDFPLWFVKEDIATQILHQAMETLGAPRKRSQAGDINGDYVVDVGDVIFLINYLFKNGPPPTFNDIADVNNDCIVDVGDIVYLINFLFKNGPNPVYGCAH